MDEDMLDCIRALAENRIQDAKDKAIICCINDTTKKNASKTSYYKKLLENGSTKMFELPLNLKGLLNVQDVSDFNEARYYLGKEQKKTYEQIVEGVNSTLKMLEYGIPYMNSTLIYGEPGTGKTEFAKYVAFKLGLPETSCQGLFHQIHKKSKKRCQKHCMAPDTSFNSLHFSVQQVFAEIRIVRQLVDI